MRNFPTISVAFKQVCFSYKSSADVFNNLNVVLPLSGITALAGDNGCGKTTFIRLLARLINPTSGHVEWSRDDFNLVYLPAYSKLNPYLSVRETIALMSLRRKEELSSELLCSLGLDGLLDKKGDQLSFGQVQRVRLAGAVSREADLYIFDEPCTALDLSTSIFFESVLSDLKSKGKAILVASHNPHEVDAFCDDILVLGSSGVVFAGELDRFRGDLSFRDAWAQHCMESR